MEGLYQVHVYLKIWILTLNQFETTLEEKKLQKNMLR